MSLEKLINIHVYIVSFFLLAVCAAATKDFPQYFSDRLPMLNPIQLKEAHPQEGNSPYGYACEPTAIGEALDNGDIPIDLTKEVQLSKIDFDTLSRRSLFHDGYTGVQVSKEAFDQIELSPPPSHSTSTGAQEVNNRQKIWEVIENQIINSVPHCWPKKGFIGLCDEYDEAECSRSDDCQWFSELRAVLIDNVKPFIDNGKTDIEKIQRLSCMFRNASLTFREAGTGIIANFYQHYTKGGDTRYTVSVETSVDSFVEKLKHNFRALSPVESLTQCSVEPRTDNSFIAIHNDLFEVNLRNHYEQCVDRLVFDDNQKFFVALEMANFWTTLDNVMTVQPLGMRRNNVGCGPLEPGGYQDCDDELVNIEFSNLTKGQGYLFFTAYEQHSALPIMDTEILEKSSSKKFERTSMEFRFFFLAKNPREDHPTLHMTMHDKDKWYESTTSTLYPLQRDKMCWKNKHEKDDLVLDASIVDYCGKDLASMAIVHAIPASEEASFRLPGG